MTPLHLALLDREIPPEINKFIPETSRIALKWNFIELRFIITLIINYGRPVILECDKRSIKTNKSIKVWLFTKPWLTLFSYNPITVYFNKFQLSQFINFILSLVRYYILHTYYLIHWKQVRSSAYWIYKWSYNTDQYR